MSVDEVSNRHTHGLCKEGRAEIGMVMAAFCSLHLTQSFPNVSQCATPAVKRSAFWGFNAHHHSGPASLDISSQNRHPQFNLEGSYGILSELCHVVTGR